MPDVIWVYGSLVITTVFMLLFALILLVWPFDD
jgi:hypothetical protein